MKEIKRKILDSALELFNKDGYSNVTVRHIAAALQISHGHLCYHFPNVQTIVNHLYYEMVETLDDAFQNMYFNYTAKETAMQLMFENTELIFGIFINYKFLMLEFVTVMRENKELKKHFNELQELRKKQFFEMFQLLQKNGWMKKEPFASAYQRLIELMMLIGNFWFSEDEIIFKGTTKEKIRNYSHLLHSLLVPYFTKKGMQEYNKYYGLS